MTIYEGTPRNGAWAFGVLALALMTASATTAGAQEEAAAFYKGKTFEILIGAAAGGGYDLPGRAIGRHIDRHIPGHPSILVRNMPGANSLIMTNHLYNVAARDGTVIGMTNQNVPLEPLMRLLSPTQENVRFDATQLQWIGSPVQETFLIYAWHTAPAERFEDLKTNEILMGATAVSGENVSAPSLTNALLGTKMRLVVGYQSQSEIFLAIERGELHGNFTGLTTLMSNKEDWVRDNQVRILIQYALEKDPELPDVPLVLDLAETDEQRLMLRFFMSKYRMARPLAAPPDVPAGRVEALRAAFDATMDDPAFRADAEKTGVLINPFSGTEMSALIEELYKTPREIIDRTRTAVLSGRDQAVKRDEASK